MKFLVLTDDDVKKSLTMKQAVDASAEAFRDLSESRAKIPVRCAVPTEQGFTGFMPGYVSGTNEALGLKLVSIRPNNPKNHNLPTIPAQVLLVHPETSQPMVLMDATYLTLLRTAAGSGVATRLMARPDIEKLVVFGAGNQALSHIEAMITERPTIKTIVILNRSHENAEKFVASLKADPKYKHLNISASQNSTEALKGALLIVTCTGSHEPLFNGDDVENGAHLNLIGSHFPHAREVDSKLIKKSKVVIDETNGAFAEAGDVVIPIKEGVITKEHVLAEIGQVVAGHQIRTSHNDITIFKSVGNAVQDLGVGLAVYKQAVSLGLGTWVDTDNRAKL
eukprot:TRINITY_DN15630_c0_g1_i1.p1 TRINITY_DN15630_c0_g1~~TRINITY_DN15630_c0_g1_i1.p1  ORF type:complete len:337 (-),score=65.84 TRINITY_DN15630_c0_g1_i1:48-1058(-)